MSKMRDMGWSKIRAELHKLAKNPYVKTGILEGPGSELYDEGAKVVEVAIKNEFGGRNDDNTFTPSRPFMRRSFDENKVKYRTVIARGLHGIAGGKQQVQPFLEKLGFLSETDTKKKLRSGPWVPNSPVTIAVKKSSQPLIDTGQLVNSITSKVYLNGGS